MPIRSEVYKMEMKAFLNKNDNKRKIVSIFFVFLVTITGIILYAPCIWGDKTLVYDDWGYDTYNQYLPAYDFFSNIFKNHNYSEYYFSYGLGSSVFVPISWITDIFSLPMILISVIFKKMKIAYLLVFAQFAKTIVGGVICFKFLKNKDFSIYGAFIGAYIFSFCGFYFDAGQHYFFSTYLVYYIMMLYAIDKAAIKKKFIFVVTLLSGLIALHSVYAAYQIYIACGAYVIFQATFSEKKIANKIKNIMFYALHMLLGMLMSMIIFLPVLYEILGNSSRVQTGSFFEKIISSFSLASYSTIKTAILRLLGNNMEGGVNSWIGVDFHYEAFPYTFSTFFIITFILYFLRIFQKNIEFKKRAKRVAITGIFVFSIISNFIPSLFNMFQYPTYRFVFAFMPMFAVVVADSVDFILESHNKKILCLVTLVVCCAVGCIIFMYNILNVNNSMKKYTVFILACIFVGCLISLILSLNNCRIQIFAKGILIVFLMINLLIDNGVSLYYQRNMLTKAEISTNYYDNNLKNVFSYINTKEKDNFYRIDRTFEDTVPDSLYSLLVPSRTLSMYNTIIGEGLTSFSNAFIIKENENDSIMSTMQYRAGNFGLTFDNCIADILGLKYIISEDSTRNDGHWKCIYENNGKKVYENKNLDSAGVIYSDIMTKSTFESLNYIEKKFALNKCIIVDDSDCAKKCELNKICYTDESDAILINNTFGNVQIDNKQIISSGINSENGIVIPLDLKKINKSGYTNILNFKLISNKVSKLHVSFLINDSYESVNSSLNIDTRTVKFGDNDYYFSVPNDAEAVVFNFESDLEDKYDFIFKDFKLYASECSYTNEGVEIENKNNGDRVEGTVNMKQSGYFMLPIVKENNWNLYVDGKKQVINQADYCFCMVKLDKGIHKIEYKYENKYFNIGIKLSCIGITFFVLELVAYVYYCKKKEKKYL